MYNEKNFYKVATMVATHDARDEYYISQRHYNALNNIMFSLLRKAENDGVLSYTARDKVHAILTNYEKAKNNLMLRCTNEDLKNHIMYIKYIIEDSIGVWAVTTLLELHY